MNNNGKVKPYIQPLQDRVLVERLDPAEVSKAGIIIPSLAQEKPQRGKVLAIGPKVTEVSVGDDVLFGKYSGTEIEEHLIMHVDDILGVIE